LQEQVKERVSRADSADVGVLPGGGAPRGETIHRSWTHGGLSMSAYRFGGAA